MHPDCRDGDDCKYDVDVQERLVECVADNGWRLEEEDKKSTDPDGTGPNHAVWHCHILLDLLPSCSRVLDDSLRHPASTMSDTLKNNDPANPSVNQIVRVEANA